MIQKSVAKCAYTKQVLTFNEMPDTESTISFSPHICIFFFFFFLLKKIRLYNIECWEKKDVQKNRYNIDNTEKKLHRFTAYKYKYRVSLQQINLITILTKTRKKKK